MHLGLPIPILRIFDEHKAREFYCEFLEFRVDWENRQDSTTPIYMQIHRDEARMHLSEHFGDSTPGSGVRIRCDDVDAFCASLSRKGYRHSRPSAQPMPWGTRDVTLTDPFGNRLTFWTGE